MTQPGTVPPRTPCPPCTPDPLVEAGGQELLVLSEPDPDPDGPETGPEVTG